MSLPMDVNAVRGGPPPRKAADPMLLACRDMALQILMQSFDGFFSRLEEIFFELAEKTHDRNLRDMYFAARAETQTKRTLIADEFKQRFIQAFNTRSEDLSPEQRASGFYKIDTPPAELSLVANDEYEESISAHRVANSLKQTGGDNLRQMEQRLARLLPFDIGDAGSPISPETICEALVGACRQLESGLDARLVAIKAFEDQLANSVADVYRHVNDFLIQHNIQPASPGAPVVRGGQTAGAASSPKSSPSPASSAPQTGPEMVSVSVPAALAHHFEMLASGQSIAAERSQNELHFLNQLQQRIPRGDQLTGGMHPERDNLVSLLLNTQWAQKLPQVDAMTLNVVALMFDRMFEDERLSDAIKGLIGRLQIPVLKVALLDPSFFSRKNHPARMLVDSLAEIALVGDGGFAVGTAGYEKLSSLVGWVVENFDDDVATFETALIEIERYLQQEADSLASKLEEQTEVLAAAELRELAEATTEAVVGARLFQRALPPLITEFVQSWWKPALQNAYGAEGEDTPAFVLYIKALDDLLWSLEPKQGPEDRLKLVNLLPQMLKTLESGVKSAGMPADVCQKFFAELVHCHAAAIRNGVRPGAVSEAAPLKVEMPAAESAALAPPAPVFEMPISSLSNSAGLILPSRGDWVVLQDAEGGLHRLRLTWISPQGTRYIFTNRAGENGRTFLRAELERTLTLGLMKVDGTVANLTDQMLGQVRDVISA
jgi:hypothetical protein